MVNGTSGIHFDSFFEHDTNGRTRGHFKKLRKKGLTRIWGSISSQIVLLTFGMLLTIEQLHLLPWTASRMDWKIYEIPNRWVCCCGNLWPRTPEAEPAPPPSGEASSVSYRW